MFEVETAPAALAAIPTTSNEAPQVKFIVSNAGEAYTAEAKLVWNASGAQFILDVLVMAQQSELGRRNLGFKLALKEMHVSHVVKLLGPMGLTQDRLINKVHLDLSAGRTHIVLEHRSGTLSFNPGANMDSLLAHATSMVETPF